MQGPSTSLGTTVMGRFQIMRALPFIFLTLVAFTTLMGEQTMNPKVVEKDGFTVIGISARTSNAKEVTSDGVIGKMWDRLFEEGVLAKIPNKADQNILAVYTDYGSDHN